MSEMVERVARAIAEQNGDDFAHVPESKSHWTREHGFFAGRFRDVNEPYQSDYLEMARAAISAVRQTRIEEIEKAELGGEALKWAPGVLMAICDHALAIP